MALRSSLWTRAFLYFYWAISFFMVHHRHQRTPCENQSWMSALREESSQAECSLCPGFHFQSSFIFHTGLNSLPDAIKTDVARGKLGGVLSSRWYSPPCCFFITFKACTHFFTQQHVVLPHSTLFGARWLKSALHTFVLWLEFDKGLLLFSFSFFYFHFEIPKVYTPA